MAVPLRSARVWQWGRHLPVHQVRDSKHWRSGQWYPVHLHDYGTPLHYSSLHKSAGREAPADGEYL